MSIHVVFLGTAGSGPTPDRSLPAVLIQRQNEQLMFDCGEGVQRQMIKAKVGFHKKTKIFISHMHGDHVLGLPGLLQTMALMGREKKLEVFGPDGIKQFFQKKHVRWVFRKASYGQSSSTVIALSFQMVES